MRTPEPWSIPRTPFTLAQVAQHGVTPRRLETALRRGHIVRLRHGVFLDAGAVPEDHTAVHLLKALAEQVAVSGLVASHETAALAHGLPLRWTEAAAGGPLHFTRPRDPRRRSRRSVDRAVHLAALPRHHVTQLGSGLLVTTVARTVADLLDGMPVPESLMLIDAALRDELTALTGTIRRSTYAQARHVAAASRPLAEAVAHVRVGGSPDVDRLVLLGDVRRESPLESFSAGHFREAGLPQPVPQAQVSTQLGDFYPDNLWEEYRVIGEADGEGKYRDPQAITREKLRDAAFQDAGYAVLHWAGAEMWRSPGLVVERVARLLRAGGWDGVARPWT